MSALRLGSLCSGYGGLDLAVGQVLGIETVWHADPDPGAAAIRTQQLRLLGNGVVPQQAAAAIRMLLDRSQDAG